MFGSREVRTRKPVLVLDCLLECLSGVFVLVVYFRTIVYDVGCVSLAVRSIHEYAKVECFLF